MTTMKKILITVAVTVLMSVGLFAQSPPDLRIYRIIDGVEAKVSTKEEAAAGFISLKCIWSRGVDADCKAAPYLVIPPDVFTWHGCKDMDIRVERDEDGWHVDEKQYVGCEILQRSKVETRKCTAIELAILHCGLRLPVQSEPCRP